MGIYTAPQYRAHRQQRASDDYCHGAAGSFEYDRYQHRDVEYRDFITVGAGLGLTITPTTATVRAGGTLQFSALLNSMADPNATWAVSSTNHLRQLHRLD